MQVHLAYPDRLSDYVLLIEQREDPMSKLLAGCTSFAFAAVIGLSVLAGSAAPADAAKGSWCRKASQCHGPLPLVCLKCTNGREGCAHWACVRHRCAIHFCSR